MRTLAAVLVAVLLSATSSAHADPPVDIRAWCAALMAGFDTSTIAYCVRSEEIAKAQAERSKQSFFGATRETYDYCYGLHFNWQYVATCIARGAKPPPESDFVREMREDTKRIRQRTEEMRQRTDELLRSRPQPSAPATRPPSTVIFGPTAPAPTPEPDRPSRPIPKTEADQQLKGVLERSGEPGTKCTKKQYGTGWVTVCE